MSSAEHLLVIAPGFPAHEQDDACIPYFQDYLHLLRKARPGIHVTVVALQYPYRKGRYTWHGIEVHALGGRNRRWLKPLIWRRARRIVRGIHAAQPVGAIHTLWLTEAAWIGQEMARALRVPHVAMAMGQDVQRGNRWLKRLDTSVTSIVALSRHTSDLLKAHTGQAAQAILPFAEPEPPRVDPQKARPIHVLGVGSLIPSKKYDRFLRVMRLLADARPGIRAHVLGDGPEWARLIRLRDELGLQGVVKFEGRRSRSRVREAMLEARVLLHPSLLEGQGYAYHEALNAGMQVVSAPAGSASPGPDWAVHMDSIRMADAVLAFLDGPGPDVAAHHARNQAAGQALVEGLCRMYGF